MKKFTLVIALSALCPTLFAQVPPPTQEIVEPPPPPVVEVPQEEVYDFAEQEPEFPGGPTEMMKFISSRIKYPQSAIDNNIQGKVYVQFIITKTGELDKNSVKVLRGVNSELDAEAIRVVKMMPKWKPGTIKGKPVNVKFNLPIMFRLN